MAVDGDSACVYNPGDPIMSPVTVKKGISDLTGYLEKWGTYFDCNIADKVKTELDAVIKQIIPPVAVEKTENGKVLELQTANAAKCSQIHLPR